MPKGNPWKCGNASYAIWWPTLQTMQMVPPDDQIMNQSTLCHLLAKFATNASGAIWYCKWCHVVAKFNPSHGVNFWVCCASGNVFSSHPSLIYSASDFGRNSLRDSAIWLRLSEPGMYIHVNVDSFLPTFSFLVWWKLFLPSFAFPSSKVVSKCQ